MSGISWIEPDWVQDRTFELTREQFIGTLLAETQAQLNKVVAPNPMVHHIHRLTAGSHNSLEVDDVR